MTTTTRNEAAEQLWGMLGKADWDKRGVITLREGATRPEFDAALGEALAAAKAEGAREAVERIRARLNATRDLDAMPEQDMLAVERDIVRILDEEAAP